MSADEWIGQLRMFARDVMPAFAPVAATVQEAFSR
jgi:hypothetical protein